MTARRIAPLAYCVALLALATKCTDSATDHVGALDCASGEDCAGLEPDASREGGSSLRTDATAASESSGQHDAGAQSSGPPPLDAAQSRPVEPADAAVPHPPDATDVAGSASDASTTVDATLDAATNPEAGSLDASIQDALPSVASEGSAVDAGVTCKRRGVGSMSFELLTRTWRTQLGTPRPVAPGSTQCPSGRDPNGDLVAALAQCAFFDFVVGTFVLHLDGAGVVYDIDWNSLGGNDPSQVEQCVTDLAAAACYPDYACWDLTISLYAAPM